MILKLISKPEKIIQIEKEVYCSFKNISIMKINSKEFHYERINFEDLEEFFVHLDKIKIDFKEIFFNFSEEFNDIFYKLTHTNLNRIIFLSDGNKINVALLGEYKDNEPN